MNCDQPAADPKMPDCLKQWLSTLNDKQTEAVYEWVVSAGPSNYVSLGIQDEVAPRATAEPE